MSADPIWHGVVHKGKVFIKNILQYAMYLNCFKENTEIELIVRKKRKSNTRQEQRYYRGVVVPYIAKDIGISNELAHGYLQQEGFWSVTDENSGFTYVRSTALNLWTTAEFEERLQNIRVWALDFLNLTIPLPNEIDF